MNNKTKKWILCFIFIVLALPGLNHKLQFIKSGPLNGSFRAIVDTDFAVGDWIRGTYQRRKELYLNDETGFRPDLVRLNNQVDYSFFDKCHANWTIKGKDGYLFQIPYINAYYGLDYCGYPSILDRAKKIKAIQDTFRRLGKSLILAYLPSKASSYPEYFPDDRVEPNIGPTNYQSFRHVCDSLGINQVDMNAWFVQMKNKSKEPLFTKQGIHWSEYGAILGGDSLIKYIEKLRNIHILHPRWSRTEHTDKLRDGDDDIAQELNLIFPFAKETAAYPIIEDVPDSGQKKINAIYIGDSYTFKMVGDGIINKMNAQCEFWYYFNEVHEINGGKFTYIAFYDWQGAVDKADCVVVAYTIFNLWQLGNGFIEREYDHFYPHGQ